MFYCHYNFKDTVMPVSSVESSEVFFVKRAAFLAIYSSIGIAWGAKSAITSFAFRASFSNRLCTISTCDLVEFTQARSISAT